ncbi:hypothetical protein GCM10023192_10910 [Amycolatopsis samaneae]
MWAWLIWLFALFVITVSGAASAVALFVTDKPRREMAYRVLKLVLGTGTGAGGVLTAALKLHDVGLLP